MPDIILNTAILSLLLQLIWLYYQIKNSHKTLVSSLFTISIFCSLGLFKVVTVIQPELYGKEQITALSLNDVVTKPHYLTMIIFALMVVTQVISILYVKFSIRHTYKHRYNVTFTSGFYQNYRDLVRRHYKQRKYHDSLNARYLLGPSGYRRYRQLSSLADALIYIMLATLVFVDIFSQFWQFAVILEVLLAFGYFLIKKMTKQHIYPNFTAIVIHTDFTTQQIIKELQDSSYINALFTINKVYSNADNLQLTNLSAHDHLVIKDSLNLDLRMLATTTQKNHQKIGIRVANQQLKVYLIKSSKTDDNDFSQGINHA
ncbi:MAG: hypothetical protein K2Y14_02070 [Burkholderiales bacterium]|nr:hypothetical protein [Burkholderiales bacterium]